MTDTYAMRDLASRIREHDPRLTPGHKVTSATRDLLERYAEACGAQSSTAYRMSDVQLIGLYQVGRKSPEAAGRMVAKIAADIDPPYLKTPPVPRPYVEPKVPEPYVNGVPHDGPSYADLEAATEKLREAIEDRYQAALKAGKDLLDASLDDAINAARDEVRSLTNDLHNTLSGNLPRMIQDALKSVTPTLLNVSVNDKPPVVLGTVHKATPKIIRWLSRKTNVYLHGPAGSGKTTVARTVAEAFGLPFYFSAKLDDEYRVLGFTTAAGDTVMTQFRLAYEFGGVFLFDEMDASGASAITALNAALANGICAFPDKLVKMHPDFRCIGAGNTTLNGATHQYVGRTQLDAASVDRFVFIEFGYDEDLERAIAANIGGPALAWCEYVQAVRAECAIQDNGRLVTPRATIVGGEALIDGEDRTEVEDCVVYKGWDKEDRDTVHRAAMRALAKG